MVMMPIHADSVVDPWQVPTHPLHAPHGATVVQRTAHLLAEEPDFARRARLLARAAGVVGQGYGLLFSYEAVTDALVPIALVNGMATPAPTFAGANSGLTPVPLITSLRLGDGLAGRAAITRAAVLAETLAPDAQFAPEAAMADAAIAGMVPRAVIALPLVSENELLGVLEILQPEASMNGFTPRILEPLGALAGLATLTLTAERRACDLRVTALRAADAQEEERRRLARDLHDGPALGIAQTAAALERIDRLIDQQPHVAHNELRQVYSHLMGSLRDLRGILFDLRPLTLEREGLIEALPHLVERRRAGDGPKIALQVHLGGRLPLGVETTVYLVIREALTNALRHARATTCDIEVRDTALSGGRHSVSITVRDNGVGFAADEMLRQYPHGQSWGLASMVERAHAFTERFAIRSAPGMGTSIEMTIDYRAEGEGL